MQVYSIHDTQIALDQLLARIERLERWQWHRRLYLWLKRKLG